MKALKANRIVSIDSKRKEEYLSNGYTILDDTEKVIAAPEKDAEKLGKDIDELKKIIAKKDSEITKLNSMIVDLQKQIANETSDDASAETKKATAKK